MDGILPAPRGTPQIEVTFDIDANGILNVAAVDKGTGKEQKITIQAASGLSEDEVEQMRSDAELHAEEDQKRRGVIELHNLADNTAYHAETMLKENEDKIDSELKTDVEEKIKVVRDALGAQETDEDVLRSALEELNTVQMKVGESVYSQQEKETSADETSSGLDDDEGDSDSPEDPGTVEGEFREV